MSYSPIYLVMITEDNHNKYYNMFPKGDTFEARWGRVGSHESTKTYPISKWESQLKSKLKKGYVERTDLVADLIEEVTDEESPNSYIDKIKNSSIKQIISRLFNYANNTIRSSYNVTANSVTQAMVDTAQKKIDEISLNYSSWTIEEFNKNLLELFVIIPRKMATVNEHLAKTVDDFSHIISKEQDILDTMAGQVYKKPEKIKTKDDINTSDHDMLEEMGITMEEASEEDIVKIKKAMGDSAHKFYKAWRVSNSMTEKEYKDFVKANHIKNTKLLCHGSRNQNWFNILKMGLLIRPSGAILTGSMFGNGIYFGNPERYHGGATKSIGYTSLNGYWTRERDNCGFLGFYEVALGNAYEVFDFNSKFYNFDLKTLQREKSDAWHLWARADRGMLRNDELVVYTTKQMTIRYLVEIR